MSHPIALAGGENAYVTPDCVGCGLCGENAHAATLCPSFYKVDVIQNPSFLDKLQDKLRSLVLSMFGGVAA
jgi:indolepyruvate ferredoxin oxidoreductase, alpha subunit